MSSVNAAEWSKAIDIESNELQRFETWDRVDMSPHRLSQTWIPSMTLVVHTEPITSIAIGLHSHW